MLKFNHRWKFAKSFALLNFYALFALPNLAFALSCGDTITTAVELSANLDCSSYTSGPVFTLGSGGKLDLGGHTLTVSTSTTAIFADSASDIAIVNGKIINARHGIVLNRTDNVLIQGVSISGAYYGNGISAGVGNTNLTIKDSVTEYFEFYGIYISGVSGLHLENNISRRNTQGFGIFSPTASADMPVVNVVKNTASSNGGGGFNLDTPNGLNISENTASDNGSGVSLNGTKSYELVPTKFKLSVNKVGIALENTDHITIKNYLGSSAITGGFWGYGILAGPTNTNLTITDNEISSFEHSGVYINKVSGLDLQRNISSSSSTGFTISSVTASTDMPVVKVVNNTARANGSVGFYLDNPPNSIDISGNTASGANGNGVYLNGTQNFDLNPTKFVLSVNKTGILLRNTNNTTIRNYLDSLAITGGHWGNGIDANESNTNLTIKDNVIKDFEFHGVYTNGVSGLHLENNISSGSSHGFGIFSPTASAEMPVVNVVNNTASSNGVAGFRLGTLPSEINILNNTSSSNGYGVYLEGTKNYELIPTKFALSGNRSGLLLRNTDHVSVLNYQGGAAIVGWNAGYGISASGDTNLVIKNNEIASFEYYGVSISGVSGLDFQNNISRQNSQTGIGIFDVTNLTFRHNTTTANGWYGIETNSTAEMVFSESNIYSNAVKNAFIASGSALPSFVGNYWGHTCPTLFTAGSDTNRTDVIDPAPYAALLTEANGWNNGGVVGCEVPKPSPSPTPPPPDCGATLSTATKLTANLDCSAYAGTALKLVDGGNLDLNGFTLKGNINYAALSVKTTGALSITNGTITNANHGIELDGTDRVTVQGVTLVGAPNGSGDSGLGITTYKSGFGNRVNTNLVIVGNDVSGYGYGIYADSVAGLRVEGNAAHGNRFNGIVVYNPSKSSSGMLATIANNTATGNTGGNIGTNGFNIGNFSGINPDITFSGNTATGNLTGLELNGVSNFKLEPSKFRVYGNIQTEISLFGNSVIEISGYKGATNGLNGVGNNGNAAITNFNPNTGRFGSNSGIKVLDNDVGGHGTGIALYGVGGADIQGNVATGNAYYGILLNSPIMPATIKDNTVTGSAGGYDGTLSSGFYLGAFDGSASGFNFSGNTSTRNMTGLTLDRVNNLSVDPSKIRISGNRLIEIYLDNTSGTTISGYSGANALAGVGDNAGAVISNYNPNTARIADNSNLTIIDNNLSGHGSGIGTYNISGFLNIERNNVHDNVYWGIIVGSPRGSATVKNNTVTNTLGGYDSTISYGFYLSGINSNLTFTRNTSTNNSNGMYYDSTGATVFSENNFYGNRTFNAFVSTSTPGDAVMFVGNYWGHTCPTLFTAGSDTNRTDVIDTAPYAALLTEANGWNNGGTAGCEAPKPIGYPAPTGYSPYGSGIGWDPVNKASNITLSNNNLTAAIAEGAGIARATESKTAGKWYWEISIDSYNVSDFVLASYPQYAGKSLFLAGAGPGVPISGLCSGSSSSTCVYFANGTSYRNDTESPFGASFAPGDVLGVALDLDSVPNQISFYKNGVHQGCLPTYSDGQALYPQMSNGSSWGGNTGAATANFAGPFKFAPQFRACSTSSPTPSPTSPPEVEPTPVENPNPTVSPTPASTATPPVSPPSNLTYDTSAAVYTVGTVVLLAPASSGGTPTTYSTSSELPDGLTLDSTTGVISGTPTAAAASTTPYYITVTASNEGGSVSTTISITVNAVVTPTPSPTPSKCKLLQEQNPRHFNFLKYKACKRKLGGSSGP